MVPFEEAGKMLDEAVDSLPQEIFENLNGGVNLIPAKKTDEDGLLIMGMYFRGQMGRHVELYYGSFCEAFSDATPEKCRRELTKTLKHELTHHLENQACDRTLEHWDDEHKAELLAGLYDSPLEAESVLFVDYDGAGLAPMAEGFFRLASQKACPEIRCSSAGISDKQPESVSERAVKAAGEFNADISAYVPRRVTRALLDSHDAVLCMTEEQAEELASTYPAHEAKIMCLGERDLNPPTLGGRLGWRRAADRLAAEIEYLIDELCGEDGENDDS
ncbi:MAG: metallopeptidase family protein [Oscillospiraceae bacterium]